MKHERRKRIAKKRRADARSAAVRDFYAEFKRRSALNLTDAITWSQANAWVPWD